jgi:uncharacterized protein
VLRGIALLGVLVANVWLWFSGAGFRLPALRAELVPPTPDWLAFHAVAVLVSGKAISTFSFLFGVGFAVQALRARERGARVEPLYRRRLAVLFCIGALHGVLLWYGDVLMAYAVLGFALLPFRDQPDGTLFAWAGVLLLAFPLATGAVPLVLVALGAPPPSSEVAPDPGFGRNVLAVFAGGDPARVVTANLRMLAGAYLTPRATWMLGSFGLFLLGLWAGRARVFERVAEHRAAFRRVAAWGLGVGLAGSCLADALGTRFPLESPAAPPWLPLALAGAELAGTVPLAAGYTASVALLMERPRWARRLEVFAPAGRMALTHYLSQTVVCLLVFYGYGLGWIGRTGPAAALAFSLLLFAAQAAWSPWWLARFRFGPAEWVWRSLTYGRLQPMRVTPPAPPPRR